MRIKLIYTAIILFAFTLIVKAQNHPKLNGNTSIEKIEDFEIQRLLNGIEILKEFKNLLISHFSQAKHLLCAHNGKEFDFPYIARRMIIHNIELPYKLNLFGKKPWEVPHLDTLELWKFGDYKNYTSLKLLTHVLNIPSPKDDIDGSDVYRVYYEENDIDKIIKYCEKDTVAVAQIFLRLRGDDILNDNEILHV